MQNNERLHYITSDFSIETAKDITGAQESEGGIDDDLSELVEDEPLRWINVIFLPFQTWWQCIMLYIVVLKCFFGPLNVATNELECAHDVFGNQPVLKFLLKSYSYVAHPIYILDTFLYIVHRQVADEAMKKEFISKSGILIIIDILASIPFFDFFVEDTCGAITFWPYILRFNECLVIYRVASFFQLTTSHSYINLAVGYLIMFALISNIGTCFLLMVTYTGFCGRCKQGIFDWRFAHINVFSVYNDSNIYYGMGMDYFMSLTLHRMWSSYYFRQYLEFAFAMPVMLFGTFLTITVLMPKLFAECVLRQKRLLIFHPRIMRIIEETQRRNPMPGADKGVEKFYSLLWKKRKGILRMPDVVLTLPQYIRTEIRQDLSWAIFFHSPSFRKTSSSYKRWLSHHVQMSYKQPGERFFSGRHCYSNLYYLKNGIVELISCDDSASSLLSVTSGTLFGDVSFYVPPRNRKIIARCLTYCEVCHISREDILRSLHKFPDDRRNIMTLVQGRLKHAHDLYKCKEQIIGLDRTEDEGFAWIKKRWWEIFAAVNLWKKSTTKKKCELPPEEHSHHCAKYIGQLVLCDDTQRQRQSLFMKVTFPWVLAPYSKFIETWNHIVLTMVYLVLLFYPPNILKMWFDEAKWFIYFDYFINVVFLADVLIKMFTAVEIEGRVETDIWKMMALHFTDKYFIMDILSIFLAEKVLLHLFNTLGHLCKFNRLFKVYMIFNNKFDDVWNRRKNPTNNFVKKVILAQFVNAYLFSYFLFALFKYVWKLPVTHIFGEICENGTVTGKCDELITSHLGVGSIVIGWITKSAFSFSDMADKFATPFDTLHMLLLLKIIDSFQLGTELFLKIKLASTFYLQNRERVNYQYFVTNLVQHYKRIGIHPDLMIRLKRYLNCHWKYYEGKDILHPNVLRDEPYDIYYKLHGDIAEKVIGESRAFVGADKLMVKDLASKAKFLILPKNSTLIMFGVQVENVTWVLQGMAKAEYHDEKGETVKLFVDNGTMLSMTSVFLNRASLMTYTAATDVEILYITIQEFFLTIKRYQNEWQYFQKCIEEVGPLFDDLYVAYVKKHRDYQKKLREKIFHERQSVSVLETTKKPKRDILRKITVPSYFKSYRTDPESKLMLHWLALRAFVVLLDFSLILFIDFCSQSFTDIFKKLDIFLRVIASIDIVLKLFMPYYDNRGIVVTSIRKCAIHYLTRGFLLDFLSTLWSFDPDLFKTVFSSHSKRIMIIVSKSGAFFSLYLFTGFFRYHADQPKANVLLLLFYWELVLLFITMFATFYLAQFSIHISTIGGVKTKNVADKLNWLPNYFNLTRSAIYPRTYLKSDEILLILFEAIAVTQNVYYNSPVGFVGSMSLLFDFIHNISTASLFWFQSNICLSLLLLYSQGNTEFQQSVSQLHNFLKAERVELPTVTKTVDHFIYWWKRTAGINVKILMNERIGVVFRQDLNYYFLKKTFRAVDTLLRGGEALERQLSSCATDQYCLAGEDIMREMDLTPYVYIVHRGKVVITKNNEKIAVLTKGSIFGHLESDQVRPVQVTARAVDRVDVVTIPIKKFQEVINEDVKNTIKQNPQSKLDFMAIRKAIPENPYNTIEYILRGSKTLKLPKMLYEVDAEKNKWYARWLLLVWVVLPYISSALTLFYMTSPSVTLGWMAWTLIALDVLHIAHLVVDFYTMELVVVDTKCIYKYERGKKFLRPWFYLDIISLIVPVTTIFTNNLYYQAARLLRMHTFYFYDKHFCRSFQAHVTRLALKFSCALLLIHALTCVWIFVFCRSLKGVKIKLQSKELSLSLTNIDQWTIRDYRTEGCIKCLVKHDKVNGDQLYNGYVPTYWEADYMIAFCNIVLIITTTNLNVTLPLNWMQVAYRVVVNYILYWIRLWFTGTMISYIYGQFRAMYHFDYQIWSLIYFLKQNGVSKFLLDSIVVYSRQLWRKQLGNWLPDIVEQAPLCLREDIMSSLYMHHLLTPGLFQVLPNYFLRQLAVKLRRVVIFPGKCVVQEGDMNDVIYFIHEGEVEKWYTDRNGDARLGSVLTINGYFGLIPGLFPNTPFQYSYYSRTVVDLVTLKYSDWQDLLNGYPDIRIELYKAAIKLEKPQGKSQSKTSLMTSKSKESTQL